MFFPWAHSEKDIESSIMYKTPLYFVAINIKNQMIYIPIQDCGNLLVMFKSIFTLLSNGFIEAHTSLKFLTYDANGLLICQINNVPR